jgi:Na+/H+-dicarboxylate symporter
MNILRWLSTLMTTNKLLQMSGLKINKRNNRGTLLWTIIGLAVMSAAYLVTKGKTSMQTFNPIQTLVNKFQFDYQQKNQPFLKADFAEFADEIMPQNALKSKAPASVNETHEQTSPEFQFDQTLGE